MLEIADAIRLTARERPGRERDIRLRKEVERLFGTCRVWYQEIRGWYYCEKGVMC